MFLLYSIGPLLFTLLAFSAPAQGQTRGDCSVKAFLMEPKRAPVAPVAAKIARDNALLAAEGASDSYTVLSSARGLVRLRKENSLVLAVPNSSERHLVSMFVHDVARGAMRATVAWTRSASADTAEQNAGNTKIVRSKVSFPVEQPLILGSEETPTSLPMSSPELIRLLKLRFSCP